jgi:hypothetical protein
MPYLDVSENPKKMRTTIKTFLYILILVISGACSSTKISTAKSTKTQFLVLDPRNYHNVSFNPKWIAENNIETIIEREYLDGKNGKVHLVTILEYDKSGYLQTKFGGLSYPKNEEPIKDDIFGRWEYKKIEIDSFITQPSKIIRFHNQKGKMEQPDTLKMGNKIYNIKYANVYLNEEGEMTREYIYDKSNRIIKELNKGGTEAFSVKYKNDQLIEISKFNQWKEKTFSSFIIKDKTGRIIKNIDESNDMTHEFYYDKNGYMIENKHWFKGKEPNYHTYEYVRRDSR